MFLFVEPIGFTNGRVRIYYSYMKIATISETKNRLSSLIDRVRHGESVIIVDRNRPVARPEPVVADE